MCKDNNYYDAKNIFREQFGTNRVQILNSFLFIVSNFCLNQIEIFKNYATRMFSLTNFTGAKHYITTLLPNPFYLCS